MPSIPWDVDGQARRALGVIIADPGLGPGVLSRPQVMANVLKDLLPDAPRESSLLVGAAEADLAGIVRTNLAHGLDATTAVRLAATTFAQRAPFAEDACDWVTAEFAIALGVDPAQVSQPSAQLSATAVDPLVHGPAPSASAPPGYPAQGAAVPGPMGPAAPAAYPGAPTMAAPFPGAVPVPGTAPFPGAAPVPGTAPFPGTAPGAAPPGWQPPAWGPGGVPVSPGPVGRRVNPLVWISAAVAVVLVAGLVIFFVAKPSKSGNNGGKTSAVQVFSGATYGFKYPWALALAGDGLWVANQHGNSVTELNASTGKVVRIISGGNYGFDKPSAIAVAGGFVWVANFGGNSVTVLNAGDGSLVRVLAGANYGFDGPDSMAVYGSDLWVSNVAGSGKYGSLTEINTSDGTTIRTLTWKQAVFATPEALLVNGNHLWIASLGGVTQDNASDGSYGQLFQKGYNFNEPDALAAAGGSIWVDNAGGTNGGSVTQMSASDGTWVRTLAGGSYGFAYPGSITSDGTHLWVGNANGDSVTEMNVTDGGWVRTLVGGKYDFKYPAAILVGGGHVWVANADGNSVTEFPAS